MKKIQEIFRTYFVAGLLVSLPFAVTLVLIRNIVEWVDSFFAIRAWSPIAVPGVGLVLALVVILLAGMLGRNIFGRWIVSQLSHLFQKVPIVGAVYTGIRQTLTTLFSGSERRFSRAVLVEWPRKGAWTVGLVSSEVPPKFVRDRVQDDLVAVFVPTTPIPTGGFLTYVPRAELKPLDMRVEEALKMIVSLGLAEAQEKNKWE